MRIEGHGRGFVSILLTLALAFSITFVVTPVLAPAVISEPGGTIIAVPPGGEFVLRFRLRWDQADPGTYAIPLAWDSPRPVVGGVMQDRGTEDENFTLVGASAYFDLDGDNLPDPGLDPIEATAKLLEGPSPDNENLWRYGVIVANVAADSRNGEFNVDVLFRAAGTGGVPHAVTENHPIVIMGTIDVVEKAMFMYTPPNPYVSIKTKVLPTYGVKVSVSPSYRSGLPGAVLNYTATVINTGDIEDTYDLSADDNAGWGLTISSTSLTVPARENRTATLTVAIPENATTCTKDNITVTVRSRGDATVEDSASCIAHATTKGVEVSISPKFQKGLAGGTLTYIVTVKNVGGENDAYVLDATDDIGWGLTISPSSLTLAPGESGSATLSVEIPADAPVCTLNNITAIATSLDNAVSASASCVARVDPLRGVEVSISPDYQRAPRGTTVNYTVTVTNRGMENDNYLVLAVDNAGWNPIVFPGLLAVPATPRDNSAYENRTSTLRVTIPEDATPGTKDNIIVIATSRTDYAVSAMASCVAHAGVLALEVSISPENQGGTFLYNIKGEYDLEYTVTVRNNGTISDNYILTIKDNLGWDLSLKDNRLEVPAGKKRSTTFYVRVPVGAESSTSDNITVVATSTIDPKVSARASCIAQAAIVDMEVTLSPSYQRGSPGETLVYLLTIKNTGTGAKPTTYNITYGDNAGWELTLDNQLTIPSGESLTTKLRVRVPENATHCIRDNLTVYVQAWGQGYEEVRRIVNAIAHAATIKLLISPSEDSTRAGENLTFTVWITNVGIKKDNYTLTVGDDAGWELVLSQSSIKDVSPGESRPITLSVSIPPGAPRGLRDNIAVTAIPASDPAARELGSCVAIAAPSKGIGISISPNYQGGMPGSTLAYAVTVSNVGTESDNYDLTVSDDAGWMLSLSENSLKIPGLERRGTILEVAVSSEAMGGTVNRILVTATSRENAELSASAGCSAYVEIPPAIVRGDASTINVDAVQTEEEGDDPPEVWYKSYPPLMAARRVGEGAVVASGLVATLRDTRWNPTPLPETAKLDVLLDVAFQWMKPGATKVLWYGDSIALQKMEDADNYFIENLYNNAKRCKQLIDALKKRGYTIEDTADGEVTPITPSLLENYDILIIPEIQVPLEGLGGRWSNGGDPDLLPDEVVETIENFVRAGGGLLIMDGTDYFGYNFYKVQNKILEGLGVDDVYFQSDQVNKGTAYAFEAEVTDIDFGANYRRATGLTKVWVYSTCSLVVKERRDREVSLSISPGWQKGLPGRTITYDLTVVNSGKLGDTYLLDVADDAGFSVSVQPSAMTIAAGENGTATISIGIPEGTPRGVESTIAVAVTSIGDPTLGGVAYGKAWSGALGVSASTSPENRSGKLGENLKFIVYVTNTGDFDDNYVLTVGDNSGWGLRISPSVLAIPENSRKFATLEVTIPENAKSGARDNVTVKATSQTDNAVSAQVSCIAQVTPFTRGVGISISPSENSGAPGENVTFTVTVRNLSDVSDNFLLMVSDNSGWGLKLDDNALAISPGGSSTTKLRVSIPENVKYGTKDNIKVVARSKQDNAIENSASCIAHATARGGVTISISPSEKTGAPGENVAFTVAVKNTGRVKDNYGLTVGDTAGWDLTLSENLLTNVESGASRTITLTVAIPSGAENGTSNRITVAARSKMDNAIENSAWCTLRASIAVVRGVEVSISPENRRGLPGRTLIFTVTVKNTGGAEDTYDLTVSDDAEWGAALSVNLLTIPAGGSATSEVSVAVPSEAAKDESTMITVTATSRGDPRVSGSAWCMAMAGEEGPPPFSLVPLAIGGAVVGGGAVAMLLFKKGIIPPLQIRRARGPKALGPLRIGRLKRVEGKGILLKSAEKPSRWRPRKGGRGILASVAD